jgi:[ribosomal protein S5]-alanine N-acetyltransferase
MGDRLPFFVDMAGTLKTSRLVLRPPREPDGPVIAAELNNWHVVKFTGRLPWPYTLDDWHRWWSGRQTRGPGAHEFAITRHGVLMGVIAYEAERGSAVLGYWLGEEHWGRGYMGEAAQSVVGYAFETSRLERLTASYQHGNEASQRILMRLGFRHVGHAKAFSRARGKMVDCAFLELTSGEWPASATGQKTRLT